MSAKRCTIAWLAILILSAASTACGTSTPVPPTATRPSAAVQAAPTLTPFRPAANPALTASDPAVDNWLIRVANGEQEVPAEASPQFEPKVAPQPPAPRQDPPAGAEENWLIRVLNGE